MFEWYALKVLIAVIRIFIIATDCRGLEWTIDLPSFLDTGCVEVTIRGSNIGIGPVIPELRLHINY